MPQDGPVIAVGPTPDPEFDAAITRGGGVPGPLAGAEGLVWIDSTTVPTDIPDSVRWVQLPFAGIENFVGSGLLEHYPGITFSSAAGAYSTTVAEHALSLLLAGVRGLWHRESEWDAKGAAPRVGLLGGSTVAIVGAGGIGRDLAPQLRALGVSVIAVNRSGSDVTGAVVVTADKLDEVWSQVDHVVLAAPATAETRSLVDASVLAQLKPHSWVINVARGALIDTDALVDALRRGAIGGVGLDVTDPEPLPGDHPLWSIPNAIITPHVANPPQHLRPALLDRVEINVRRVANGLQPLAVVDRAKGY
ncbi:D-isomer specific 2-hydroxyacid dehydrogenase NAD-binding protein OS=Tsukamurella paurometabola (strain ATCC 8368 / DSM / CCUG 35730 / CIP 100753 / JCM 10117 / KCTC 9821 / NBRC 16120 / NCIMB 702349 / NCTC 13040)OX=521096 GN=Tpau_0189 PE=4 SV=1 [Tsukamurella paurometabola]|uniref:D-isomer specific 2-hydroxyacid dehydrogenase NAD-binding protein n=1 Tax=Tsukamurella paurometabola (strain ATCC 8368 / DSM 20162 / CCUG 35730 / CIP 100753 / JCM 10117 / KCTC 9821 / NBRC 16120 / NCIMB 702349 / NCTC 13040) TaxID=521096 RepID=D5UQL0_TSUPD|nr:D-isomer specific 2-hydroxyacid dehydrogenase family protein [Tsukamurella paurometabola]ADG76843.1 D-isomer specific 2-hydroxyacid dehydrogenase NAD-binding protein [Tsukamurella paurometabola DSM 20162]SUP41877.1 Putative 2-hydroxyacid dehydrogenase HI_1556 [Tsukamurella paurometabola]